MPAAPGSKVYFFQMGSVRLPLRNRTRLKVIIERLFKNEKHGLARLNYVFCSDKFLLRINRDYLGHDEYTDIISFDLTDPGEDITGEIYISIDRVRDNARMLRQPVSQELLRVIFHGALHLCGYGDKSEKELKKMREMEDKYLKIVSRDTVSG